MSNHIEIYKTKEGSASRVSFENLSSVFKKGTAGAMVVAGLMISGIQGELSFDNLTSQITDELLNKGDEVKEVFVRKAFYPDGVNIFEIDEAMQACQSCELSYALANNISYVEDVAEESQGLILR